MLILAILCHLHRLCLVQSSNLSHRRAVCLQGVCTLNMNLKEAKLSLVYCTDMCKDVEGTQQGGGREK